MKGPEPPFKERKRVVILGAGPSGLSVGWGLIGKDVDVTVLEATDAVGGLSRTLEKNGIRFDIGPHRLSAQLPDVVEAVRGLLDGELLEKENLHAVYFGGILYSYPPKLRDFLNFSSFKSTVLFGTSWLWARAGDVLKGLFGAEKGHSFEESLRRLFGKRFCNTVIFPMMTKVWGTKDMHPEFAGIRFQLPTVSSFVRRLFFKRARFNVRYFYYPPKGFGHIWERLGGHLRENGQKIELGAKIKSIGAASLQGPFTVDYVQGGVDKTVEADLLLSSIPNGALLGYLSGTGLADAVLSERGKFHSRTLRLGILLVKGFNLPTRVIIFPEDRYIFNRISEMNHFADLGYPEGHAVLMVDVICEKGGRYDLMKEAEFDSVLLEAALTLGWFKREDVVMNFGIRIPETYPVLNKERYEAQETVSGFFAGTAVVLCGREASSDYNNAHNAVAKGFLAARYILGEISYGEYENSSRVVGRLPIQD